MTWKVAVGLRVEGRRQRGNIGEVQKKREA